MNAQKQILIKDPYLHSTSKAQHFQTDSRVPGPRNYEKQYTDNSKWKIEQQMKKQLERTQNQFRRMARAYTQQNRLNKKILDFQAVNGQYHEALKIRNLDLNNRLNDMVTHNHLLNTKFETDCVRNYHEKDMLLRKYESQAEQLLQAKKTINILIEQKTKLQEQLQHLVFLLDKESDRFNLQMKQQMLRMEGLERSIKNITEVKDQEIGQLRNKVRIYEDQNKRLGDENRSLNVSLGLQKDRDREREKQNRGGLDNISQIHHVDSNMKDPTIQKQLQDQKYINEKLQKQLDDLKKKLFSSNQANTKKEPQHGHKIEESPEKVNGIISSINTLRNGINKEIFEVFYKSVKDGEKHRKNWKNIDLQRIKPYIESYLQSRENLKQICLSDKYKGKPIQTQIQECIPLHIALKKGRSQINSWILSTIQHTKNQRQSSKNNMNNLLLFLFRLLTIFYRIEYPMQGKTYTVDKDVKNQLEHQIVKAIKYIMEFH